MTDMGIRNKQNSQSGQALVEYVLLVAIVVALILGLMNQLYRPFGNWMNDYLGQYLECLLDVGELPSMGGEGASGECNSRFASFSATAGRPPIDPRNNSNSRNRNNLQSQQNPPGGGPSGSGDTAPDSNSGSPRASRTGSSASFQVGVPTGADGDSPSDGGQIEEKLPSTNYLRLQRQQAIQVNSQAPDQRTGLNQTFVVAAPSKKSDGEARPGTVTVISEELGPDNKPKKLIIKPPERNAASVEDSEESWNFSDYLRYGLIILIIIALVLFLVGQAAQISKSMEKN